MIPAIQNINTILPEELMLEVFSYLPDSALGRCRQVCKKWLGLASDERFLASLEPPEAFGQKALNTLIGKVTNIRRLPTNIRQILDSPCPIWDEKTVKDTHILFWYPTSVNDAPHTINHIGKLVSMPGKDTGYELIWDRIVAEFGSVPNPTGKWLLMTKKVLPGTEWTSLDQKMDVIKRLNKKAKTEYRMFKPLEVITGCFAEFKRSGTSLYSNITLCDQRVRGHHLILIVFDSGGLRVNALHGSDCRGCGVLREI
jgi:hypothetical protein